MSEGYYTRRDEEIDGVPMQSAYAHDGSYVGDYGLDKSFFAFLDQHGIKPERREPESKVASVGFSQWENCWYGWSHRAMSRFETRSEAAKFAESVS